MTVPTVIVREVRLDSVEPQSVQWLWPGRVPFGKLTLLEGDPGLGKSTVTLDLAARLSRGQSLPGGSPCQPATALFVSYEDGVADTIVPRLRAAGADLSRILTIEGVSYGATPEHIIRIPDDVIALGERIVAHDARLVVIDPLGAAISGQHDSYKDAEVRSALAPLARIADETGAAVVLVRHLTKGGASRAIAAGGGSIGIAGAARAVLAVHTDPSDPTRRVLAMVKNNLAPLAPSLGFSLADDGHGFAKVEWLGESDHTAEALNAARANAGPADGSENEVDAWLREVLSEGPRDRKDVHRLARDAGFHERTVERARGRIRATTKVTGFGANRSSTWSLGEAIANGASLPSIASYGSNGRDGSNGATPARERRTRERDGREVIEERRPTAHGDKWFPVEVST